MHGMEQKEVEKWIISRLDHGSLMALYRRLDDDGNGQLELSEFFEITRKLKIKAPQELLLAVFNKCDNEGKGYLNEAEFEVAYHWLYDMIPKLRSHFNGIDGDKNIKPVITSDGRSTDCIITAIRYGSNRNDNSITFEKYTGMCIYCSDSSNNNDNTHTHANHNYHYTTTPLQVH